MVKEQIIETPIGEVHKPAAKVPFDLNIQFSPNSPITYPGQKFHAAYGLSSEEQGIEETPKQNSIYEQLQENLSTAASFINPLNLYSKIYDLDVYGREFYEFNTALKYAHIGYEKFTEPKFNVEANFNPGNHPELLSNIDEKYVPYILEARSLQQMQYMRDRSLKEQHHDEVLHNGSMFSRIMGGINGAILDPITWIPIANYVKYAKIAPTIFKAAMRSIPGTASASVLMSAANQMDKVNGNLHDFVVEAGINTVFASTLFGLFGGVGVAADRMQLWRLKDLAKGWAKGIDFKLSVGEKGEIKGYQAFDTSGSMGAAEVDYYQKMANSSFHMGGIFKLPYVGPGILHLAGAPFGGSPLIAMFNSRYMTERAFIDRAADHGFVTEGVAKGETQPKSFEHLMKQEHAELRSIASQLNALHYERMGFNASHPRIAQDVVKGGLGLYNTALKKVGADLDKFGFVTREQFNDEVQTVLRTGQTSEHGSVNEAASILRKKIDDTWKASLESKGKSTKIISPKMAEEFLMRVYDTPYLNNNFDKWTQVISNYLREADELITTRMEPIESLENQIKEFERLHTEAVEKLGTKEPPVTSKEVTPHLKRYRYEPPKGLPGAPKGLEHTGTPAQDTTMQLKEMKNRLKSMKEQLQNELRENKDWAYHIEDIFALSANEAKELTALLKPKNDLISKIKDQKAVVSDLKAEKSRKLSQAKTKPTKEKAKPHAEEYVDISKKITEEEEKLNQLKRDLEDEEYNLYSKARNGEVNEAFYYPETHQYKDPNYRLKFRDRYDNQIVRENHAKAYWSSIMHMNPEDIIADIMGKISGNRHENTLLSRSLLVPDDILYRNNFMTNDLMAKVNNYVLYLSRRTNLKNVFKDVTHEGGIEPLIANLRNEYMGIREPFDKKKANFDARITKLEEKSQKENIKPATKQKITEQIDNLKSKQKKIDKKLNKEIKRFNNSKERMEMTYKRMMGQMKRERWEILTQGVIRALTAAFKLHFLPATMISDLGAAALQAGTWPVIRDGVYPFLESIGGLLKTKDSEAIREQLAHLHLGLNDVLNGHADKNISLETQPYLNLGPIVSGVEKFAHYSSNLDLTTYIENNLQKIAGSAWQSNFMKALVDKVNGKLSPKDGELLRRYGIDPDKWAERMVTAYKQAKGAKTKLGTYMSMHWKWQDLEAANEFQSAVFKAINNTIIRRGLVDSPFWADNVMGMFFHTFTGWLYASFNRYLLGTMQRPDAEKAVGIMFSFGTGALVGPLRRLLRGDNAYPDDMSDTQKFWEAADNSAISASLSNMLSYANMMSNEKIFGEMKSDKYRNRTAFGSSSPVLGSAQSLYNIISMFGTGEMNEKDMKEAARLFSISGSTYGYWLSKQYIEGLGLPKNRRAAHAANM